MSETAARMLTSDRVAFMAGSGISAAPPTRIDTGAAVVRAFCGFLGRDDRSRARLLELSSSRLRFEVLLYYVEQCLGLELLNYFGTRILPNRHHLFLAGAMAKGIPVLTTNFDRCIESACEVLDVAPRVLIHPQDFNTQDTSSFLAKLHGSVTDIPTIQATTRAIAAADAGWRSEEPKARFIERIATERLLVVVGYSGSDDFDINPVFESAALCGFVWIAHSSGPIIESRVSDLLTLEKCFGGKPPSLLQRLTRSGHEHQMLVVHGQTADVLDLFAEQLSLTEELDAVVAALAEGDKEEHPTGLTFEQYLNLLEGDSRMWYGPKCLVAAMIFGHFDDHRAVRDVLLPSPKRFEGPAAAYRELLLGKAANGLGEAEEARTRTREALRLAEASGSGRIAGEGKLLLGRLETAAGRFEAAEQLLLEAAVFMGEAGGGALAMLDLAELYFRQGRSEEALEAVGSAYGISVEQGSIEVEVRANELFRRMGHDLGRSASENWRIMELLRAQLPPNP